MGRIHPLALRANRTAEHAASRARVEYQAARERARSRADKARETLAVAVRECGLGEAQAVTLRAAAEHYAKSVAVLIPAPVLAEPDPAVPHPLAGCADSEGGEL